MLQPRFLVDQLRISLPPLRGTRLPSNRIIAPRPAGAGRVGVSLPQKRAKLPLTLRAPEAGEFLVGFIVPAGRKQRTFGDRLQPLACPLPRSSFSNHHKGCPQRRIGTERVRSIVHVGEHGAPQRLGAAELGIGFDKIEC
jgi:hypothetical protein